MKLLLNETYSRLDVMNILRPDIDDYKSGSGYWGISGIIRVHKDKDNFVFFVTFGRTISNHKFDENIDEDGVLNWQSQPSQSLDSEIIKKFIQHDPTVNNIFLFIRLNKKSKYTYAGKLNYLSHLKDIERPVYFKWQLLDWKNFAFKDTFDRTNFEKPKVSKKQVKPKVSKKQVKPKVSKKQVKSEINEIFTNVFTDKFIKKINAGANLKELSREYGIGYSLLRNLKISLEEKGLLKKITLTQHKINAIAQNRKDELIEYFKLGKNLKFISEKIGYKSFFVKGALRIVLSDGQEPLTDHELKALMFENKSSLKNEIAIEKEKQKQERLKNKFSSGRYREINELRNQGKTFEEIGQKFNLTRERIRQLIKKIEINGPYDDMQVLSIDEIREIRSSSFQEIRDNELKKILINHEDELIRLYKEGKSDKDIQANLGLKSDIPRVIYELLKKLKEDRKITAYRPSAQDKEKEEQLELNYKIITKMREDGKTLNEIGTELGYSRIWVAKAIRDMRDKGIYVEDNHQMASRIYDRDWEKINYRSKIIKKMLSEGKKVSEIDKFLGLARGAVSRHIKKHLKDEL